MTFFPIFLTKDSMIQIHFRWQGWEGGIRVTTFSPILKRWTMNLLLEVGSGQRGFNLQLKLRFLPHTEEPWCASLGLPRSHFGFLLLCSIDAPALENAMPSQSHTLHPRAESRCTLEDLLSEEVFRAGWAPSHVTRGYRILTPGHQPFHASWRQGCSQQCGAHKAFEADRAQTLERPTHVFWTGDEKMGPSERRKKDMGTETTTSPCFFTIVIMRVKSHKGNTKWNPFELPGR